MKMRNAEYRGKLMVTLIRAALFLIMSGAFILGFMKVLTGNDLERLHIFLFNLTCGGFIIIYHTEGKEVPSPRSLAFFGLSIIYSLLAFFELYIPAIAVSLSLAVIAETVRIRKFSFFPFDFFRRKADIAAKFNQASLLCLSLALVISSLVILNDTRFHWVTVEKLTLNMFFLGYSFPVSLITLSVMFHQIEKKRLRWFEFLEHAIFWTVNLGVIVFFAFILLEQFIPEVAVASSLAAAVAAMFYLFFKYGAPRQQKYFLVSGMVFLLFTAITGVSYIVVSSAYRGSAGAAFLLKSHSYLSLYGWNLSGMLVILRSRDFPLKLNSFGVILVHWITVGILAPLGMRYPELAVASSALFVIYLGIFLRGASENRTP